MEPSLDSLRHLLLTMDLVELQHFRLMNLSFQGLLAVS